MPGKAPGLSRGGGNDFSTRVLYIAFLNELLVSDDSGNLGIPKADYDIKVLYPFG